MFYSQPLATRFGTDLIRHLGAETWDRLDIAVAWVRASGIAHIAPALTAFLQRGKELHVVVGIDLDNTTKEGLEGLLSLQEHGTASIFIHHNEAGTIFHPKLYLFRNSTHGTLIVGSNNITEAGLFQNTEAGLEINVALNDPVIVSAENALDAWRDISLGLARRLDTEFLTELVDNGYLKDEATVKAEAAARRKSVGSGTSRKKLFGGVSVTPPAKPASPPVAVSPAAAKAPKTSVPTAPAGAAPIPVTTGKVLLMRVRKARGTQVQIPLAVLREPFFGGATQVTSVADGVARGIHATHAKRAQSTNPNTLKLEMPETHNMNDPVARFERSAAGIQYEVYDATSPKGQSIMQSLTAGRLMSPPTTRLTVPSAPNSSTWWRFI
ncbi:phospholipase D-like domain-containing protein [Paraburkholderia solisilvae]|uniref:Phospholipase D-like domain-containing protein n=1 Tax=Paraburkholderia solisilvae TaxID=624376 RepID=A0A6J5EG01_9BURK|nr:phospholipase D-like domain-containing protein [Paraburkholderia solisilvae]CAB3764291.1 hypothetical protein LMG29739_04327 [Paraburkholderia solisilvae]